ncbi:2-polyprenyl-6-methoxyphenol hydroxylase-like FAD-dependent oxidoreductase [Ureibacillus xyleni]|uniref:2-polyprenyl-6-methoxyphenol hydroxylase-like FAD-dependent oxidoreductase n=1 Tax=Ureibacillus xyleni TaxID=614648 RepID=A0A285SDT9_9BACL|nr:FAD-dependent monooxygenase [Ureibacillus xyleni]SOC05358.1 2-polyprenyl-6-methoxyphenol hydroxylase-like FAD-dependent oxidoreductase [Ureibacillus xyleni]
MNINTDICIVGAGPGGALLAYLLAKQGMTVILLERHKEVFKEFRGEHLNEEGEEILKKHDLFSKIEELGLLRMETLEYWENGKLFKTIYPDPSVGHLGIHVPQAHLLNVLINEAKKYPNFTLMTGTTVKDLIQDESGSFTGVRAIQNGNEIMIHCHLTIGADGRYSTVRKKVGIDVEIRKHGYDLLWAKIPAPPDWEPSIKMALIDDMQLSLFTQAKGFIQIGWNIREGSFTELRRQPFTPFIEKLIKAFPQLEQTVKENITSWHDFVLLDVHSNFSEEWGRDGVALIGDAVHTMTPTGAFGLNSALKDADTLATLLTQHRITDLDLLSCATQRKKEIEKLQKIQIEKEQTFATQFVLYS